jgi:hypothetical protein
MAVELLLIDYDTNRTTFVVPKWLSVKEKYIIQPFSKIAFKSQSSYAINMA